jgi:serine/threonine-protein kinase
MSVNPSDLPADSLGPDDDPKTEPLSVPGMLSLSAEFDRIVADAAAVVPADPPPRSSPATGMPGFEPASSSWSFPQSAPRRSRPPWLLWATGGVIAAVVIVAVLVWQVFESDDISQAGTQTAAAQTPKRDPGAEAKLRALLPAGYAGGVCTAVDPPQGSVAKVSCGPNTDFGGPTSSTYTLFGDKAALAAALDKVVAAGTAVVCPGNIQTPVLCPTGVSKAVGELCRR